MDEPREEPREETVHTFDVVRARRLELFDGVRVRAVLEMADYPDGTLPPYYIDEPDDEEASFVRLRMLDADGNDAMVIGVKSGGEPVLVLDDRATNRSLIMSAGKVWRIDADDRTLDYVERDVTETPGDPEEPEKPDAS